MIRFSAVHWLLMGGLLHLVQRRWACAGGGATLSPILAVLNVIAHPSTASVPTLYCSMWHHNTFGLYRVNWESLSLCPSRGCGVVSPTKGIRRCRSGTCWFRSFWGPSCPRWVCPHPRRPCPLLDRVGVDPCHGSTRSVVGDDDIVVNRRLMV